jgi:hypothetical protein
MDVGAHNDSATTESIEAAAAVVASMLGCAA